MWKQILFYLVLIVTTVCVLSAGYFFFSIQQKKHTEALAAIYPQLSEQRAQLISLLATVEAWEKLNRITNSEQRQIDLISQSLDQKIVLYSTASATVSTQDGNVSSQLKSLEEKERDFKLIVADWDKKNNEQKKQDIVVFRQSITELLNAYTVLLRKIEQ